jgi:hypothetical protein
LCNLGLGERITFKTGVKKIVKTRIGLNWPRILYSELVMSLRVPQQELSLSAEELRIFGASTLCSRSFSLWQSVHSANLRVTLVGSTAVLDMMVQREPPSTLMGTRTTAIQPIINQFTELPPPEFAD